MGIKRSHQRRMDELRVEAGMKKGLKKKLAGHMERLGDEQLSQRAGTEGEEDRNCDGMTALREI